MAKPSMAGKSNSSSSPPPLVTVKKEYESPSPSPSPSIPASAPAATPAPLHLRLDVKGESVDRTTGEAMESQKEKVNQPVIEEPQFLKSLNELGGLSSAIDAFRRRYDELQKHLEFIHNAIDSRFKCTVTSSSSLPILVPEGNHPMEKQMVPIIPAKHSDKPEEKLGLKPIEDGNDNPAKQQEQLQDQSSTNDLKYLCETMSSRELRKYIIAHLSDVAKLREEVPVALKRAPNPGKLVFDCFGRFFLQGSRAYSKDSPMIPSRLASILILEFFVLMMNGCNEEVDIELSVKEEARSAAQAWRKRLIIEGGLSKASEIDSKGLLLLVASFGFPAGFRIEDIGYLIHSCKSSEIANALCQSHVLLARIPDIIEEMMKNGMNVEAVDVAYTFGVEDKFSPQTILTPFLRDAKEAWRRKRRDSNSSVMLLKEANKKHLAALKSAIKCLEDRNIDPSKLLPGWQIRDKALNLEKDNIDLDKKLEDKAMSKRKVDEIDSSSKLKSQELKRSRFTSKGSPLLSRLDHGLHEQGAGSHATGKNFMSMNSLDGGRHYSNASAPQHISAAGSLHKVSVATTAGVGVGMYAAEVGVGMSSGLHSTGAYSGVHREMLANQVGQTMNTASPYGWHHVGDTTLNDRLTRQSYLLQPASTGVNSLFGSSPSIKGFAGLLDHSSADGTKRSSTTDLYHFADSVVEGEIHHSSSSRNAIPLHHPSAAPLHHSSVVPFYHSSVVPSYHSPYL